MPGQRRRFKDQKELPYAPEFSKLDDKAIWTRISTVWWLLHTRTAIQKFGSLVEMQLAQEESSPQSYLDDKTGWEIAVMIARHFRKLLKKRVKQSPYFAIMADETTDISTTAQLVIYIKFIEYDDETSTARVVTEYLDLITPASGEAQDLIVYYTQTPILIQLGCHPQLYYIF